MDDQAVQVMCLTALAVGLAIGFMGGYLLGGRSYRNLQRLWSRVGGFWLRESDGRYQRYRIVPESVHAAEPPADLMTHCGGPRP